MLEEPEAPRDERGVSYFSRSAYHVRRRGVLLMGCFSLWLARPEDVLVVYAKGIINTQSGGVTDLCVFCRTRPSAPNFRHSSSAQITDADVIFYRHQIVEVDTASDVVLQCPRVEMLVLHAMKCVIHG